MHVKEISVKSAMSKVHRIEIFFVPHNLLRAESSEYSVLPMIRQTPFDDPAIYDVYGWVYGAMKPTDWPEKGAHARFMTVSYSPYTPY